MQEQIFDLVFYTKGGFTYSEVYIMPVYLRQFYLKKLQKIFKDRETEHEKSMRKMRSPKGRNVKRPNIPRVRK